MNPIPPRRHLRDLPPRHINLFTKATVLFGGFFQQFGWMFFCMGSLFSWLFIPASEVVYWFENKKNWVETTGTIVSSEPTNSSVNNQLVYQYFYWFEVDGERHTGKSYATGQAYQEGQEVTIRYDKTDPGQSYIAGSNRAVFPAFVLFVLLFPVIGLGFILTSLPKNWRALRLLEIGEFTMGKLASKERTYGVVKVNGRQYPIYRYRFEFQVGGRAYTAVCKTHQGWLVEDEEQEIILFDRYNPDYNFVFDSMPNLPAISEAGMLEGARWTKVVNLVLPAIGIGIHLLFLWIKPNIIG